MEQINHQRTERKQMYTRTFAFYSKERNNYVGASCAAQGKNYLVVKIGATTQMCFTDSPVSRGAIIDVRKQCSIRIQDRDQSTFFVISSCSIEWSLDRWPRMVFETVDLHTKFGHLIINDKEVETEFKCGVAHGVVAPYTEEADQAGEGDIELPGVKFIKIEGSLREERERLKEKRDEREEVLAVALKTSGSTRAQGRIHGLRFERVIELEKSSDVVPQGRAFKRGSSSGSSFECEGDQLIKQDTLQQGVKTIMSQSFSGIPGMQTHNSELIKPPRMDWADEMEQGAGRIKMPTIRLGTTQNSLEEAVKVMTLDEPKFNDNYYKVVNYLSESPDCAELLNDAKIQEPSSSGTYDRMLTQISFKEIDLPLYIVESQTKNYTYKGVGKATSAVVIESQGIVHIVPTMNRN
uniref:Non-structural protein NS2 n=1 Tax=Umatilla virus TaxID=40060 RepID=A0A5S9EFF6_9REOV|nr:NS2 [Umatilla virus]